MGLQIVTLTNRDADFYPLMGPFLARREVEREVGGRIYDEDERVWFVAVDRGQVVGFCAAQQRGRWVVYQSAYVVPSRRRAGVYRRLWRARAALFPGPARAVCTPASLPMFLAHGFRRVRDRGRFVEVARD